MEPSTVYSALDKKDIEALIHLWNERLVSSTDKWRHEEEAKEAYHDDMRPVVKKLAHFVELWEEVDAKERASDELSAARMARSGV